MSWLLAIDTDDANLHVQRCMASNQRSTVTIELAQRMYPSCPCLSTTLGGGIGNLGRYSGLPETHPRALLKEEEDQMSARKQHIPRFRNYGDTLEKAKLPWKVQIEIETIGHARDHNIIEEHQS